MIRRFERLRAAGVWDGAEVTVLGSGGAARAALAAAQSEGVRATVVARKRRRRPSTRKPGSSANSRSPNDPSPSSLLVHATPVGGMTEGDLPFLSAPWLAPGMLTGGVDFVYGPEHGT